MKQLIVSKLYEKTGYRADLFLVSALINFAAALKVAAEVHEIESHELLLCCDEFEEAAYQSMFSTTMDYPENVTKVLRPRPTGSTQSPISFILSPRDPNDEADCGCSEEVNQAGAFFEGPLFDCMKYDLTKLLSTAQVVTFVHGRFYGCLRYLRELPIRRTSDLFQVRSGITSYRYAPYTMFFFEAIMKLFYACLVAVHVVSVKSAHDCVDTYTRYIFFFSCARIGLWEKVIYFFTITSAIYELGEILHKSRAADDMPDVVAAAKYRVTSGLHHITDRWNLLDVLTLTFISIWSVQRGEDRNHGLAHTSLSLAAITLTLSSLRFYSLSQHAGQMMLMVFEILKDLRSFVFVLSSCMLGFGIVYRGLFPSVKTFSSARATFLTLVDSALGQHDFEVFAGNAHEVNGVSLMIFYKILVTIVILNLIVARMSATHDKINDNSLEVWAKLQAVNTQQFMLLRERNIFCVLPAPLNVLSILAGVVESVQRFFIEMKLKKKLRILVPNKKKMVLTKALAFHPSHAGGSDAPTTPTSRLYLEGHKALDELMRRRSTDNNRPSIISAVADKVVSFIMAPWGAFYEVYLANKAVIQAPVPRWVPGMVIAFTMVQLPVIITMYFLIIMWCVIAEPMPIINEVTREIQFHGNNKVRKCFSLPERWLGVLYLAASAIAQFLFVPRFYKPFGAAMTMFTLQIIDGQHTVRDSYLRVSFGRSSVRRYNNLQNLVRKFCKEQLAYPLTEKQYLDALTIFIHSGIVLVVSYLWVPKQYEVIGCVMLIGVVWLILHHASSPVLSPRTSNSGTNSSSATLSLVVPSSPGHSFGGNSFFSVAGQENGLLNRKERKLTGQLMPKYQDKDISSAGVMNVNIMRVELPTHGKSLFQRKANPYVIATYPTSAGDLVQYTDTKKSGGTNVMWSHQTCRFALEDNHHFIKFEVFDRIDVDSDDATCDELLCWTESVSIREWVANRRFEGWLPLYDASGKLPDQIQLDAKIQYRSKDSGKSSSEGPGSPVKPGAIGSDTPRTPRTPRSSQGQLNPEPLYTDHDRARIFKQITNVVVAATGDVKRLNAVKEKVRVYTIIGCCCGCLRMAI
jgi:hypothetical protein